MTIATLIASPQAWLAENGLKLGLYAAGAGALFIGGCHFGEMRKAEQIGELQASLQVCRANSKTLAGAVNKQNASIEATAAEGKKRVETSQAATEKARPTIDRLTAEKARADAYQRPAGEDACKAAQSIIEVDNAN